MLLGVVMSALVDFARLALFASLRNSSGALIVAGFPISLRLMSSDLV